MKINVYAAARTGNTLATRPFENDRAGSFTEGFVHTPNGAVEVYLVASETPWGYLSANYDDYEFRAHMDDAPGHTALVRRAHAMMRAVVSGRETF